MLVCVWCTCIYLVHTDHLCKAFNQVEEFATCLRLCLREFLYVSFLLFLFEKKKFQWLKQRDGDVFSCAMKSSWYICSNYLVHLVFNIFYMPERRQAEAARIREKYPDRIPVRIFFFFFKFLCLCFYLTLNDDVCIAVCRWLWKGLKRVTFLTLIRKS